MPSLPKIALAVLIPLGVALVGSPALRASPAGAYNDEGRGRQGRILLEGVSLDTPSVGSITLTSTDGDNITVYYEVERVKDE